MDVGLLMLVGGFAAGVFGSWLGLGGGTLIVPLLTLGLASDLRHGRGGVAGLRDHDEQCRRGGLPRAPHRQSPAGHEPGAVHGHRGAGRRIDRLPRRRAPPVGAVRGAPRVRRVLHGTGAVSRARRRGRRVRGGTDLPNRPWRNSLPSGHAAIPMGTRQAAPRERRGSRLRGAQPWPGRGRGDRSRRGFSPAGDRWRHDQGPADAPRHGRAAARCHGDEQPDDGHHGGRRRGHLPTARRDRSVRGRPDCDRRVPGRHARLQGGAPDRAALSASVVRGGHGLHGDPDAAPAVA